MIGAQVPKQLILRFKTTENLHPNWEPQLSYQWAYLDDEQFYFQNELDCIIS